MKNVERWASQRPNKPKAPDNAPRYVDWDAPKAIEEDPMPIWIPNIERRSIPLHF